VMTATVSTDAAAAMLGDLARRHEPLAPLTTYRVGGPAAVFVRVGSISDLDRVAAAVAATGVEVLVLGRGSNLLVADDGFCGLVVTLGEFGTTIELGPDWAIAGAGVLLPQLARQTAKAALRGFEWAVGVPGSIGGAVRMNAGGHGADMAGCLQHATIYDLSTGTRSERTPAELGLRFRGSNLAAHEVVVDAQIRLTPGDGQAAKAEIDEIVRWRRQNQPGGQNAGSVFVNPVPGEVSAGGLIDGLGLRGHRIGTAEVSTKHANFIQADPGGRAADVVALIRDVRRRVADATGYVLRSEVRLVGFGPDGDALLSSDSDGSP
jgi:UDP-N-acetylmuramate dehydrogenase